MSLKSPCNVRFYFENVNGLPISHSAWRLSHKHKRLRQIIRRLDIDSVAIDETQINPSLLFNSNIVHDNLFRSEHHADVISNNSNELLRRRKQGGIMLSTRNDLSKHSSTVGLDSTGLCCWVYSDMISPQKKTRIICTHQCVRSIQTPNTVLSQQQRYFFKISRNIFPRVTFREDFTWFLE